MSSAAAILFYLSAGLLLYAQLGYAALLCLLARLKESLFPSPPPPSLEGEPFVSLIVAAHNEERVIAEKVENLRVLAYPRERFEVIVSCDGCTDRTAARARAAGADLVLELPRGGKVRAQDSAVERARGEILAFSDANASWDRFALRALLFAFALPDTGYACGQVRYTNEGQAQSQEGLYWRFELALRRWESALYSVTGGNGAIYAVRRAAYLVVDPVMGHDLSFPFNMVKRGWRARYVPTAVAEERMVPTVEGEFGRKRRMMSHTWPILLRTGLLVPFRYPPTYYWMIISHRLLRYLAPFLHLLALGSCAAAAALGGGMPFLTLLWLQGLVVVAFVLGRFIRIRTFLLVRHYLLGQVAILLGLFDWLTKGTNPGWSQAEGTR